MFKKSKPAIILFIILGVMTYSSSIYSQSIAINSSNDSPDPSAILDVKSTTQGILFPRMTLSQRLSIDSPPDGLMVYQTDGEEGIYVVINNNWKGLTQSKYDNIPIGGIIDWLPQGQSIPEGFVICDGTTVSDSESPYYNTTLPNLDEKFIIAVDIASIGTEGGALQHSHSFNFGTLNTENTSNPHTHNVNGLELNSDFRGHSHSLYVNTPFSIEPVHHNHEWGRLDSNENWYSGDDQLLMNWSNGAGAEGSGYYPIAKKSTGGLSSTIHYYTDMHSHNHNNGTINVTRGFPYVIHNHKLTLPARITEEDYHTHSVSLGLMNTSLGSNLPPYITLVKIMRIK